MTALTIAESAFGWYTRSATSGEEIPTMKSRRAIYVCAALIVSIPISAQAQTIIQEATLAADAAQELASAALAYCRKEGHKVSITVLDHTGRAKATVRDDG